MPVITERRNFNGFQVKIERLGLQPLLREVETALQSFQLFIEERKHANGTKGIRQKIDAGFSEFEGWKKVTVGGVDWTKSDSKGSTVAVEVQVSGRSDLLAVDVLHLGLELTSGTVDVGMIIVPDDILSRFLTDRTPNLRTAMRHIDGKMAVQVLAFRHDGVGDALAKMRTNIGGTRHA